mmetsp:Transcript_43177/g.91960  ORF Transcript_43177/g.91960 Transcript_43177/m.91960 type:complete len:292 (-) Transcript_43177:168-1043(-)
MPDEAAATPMTLVASGFAAGVVVTGILNPYDRALFLSVAMRRPFLHPCNWRSPYQGIGQSIVGRAISSGLWFPLERAASDAFCANNSTMAAMPPGMQTVLAGQVAGGVNALLLQPLSYIKYQTWGLPEGKRSFQRTARKVYRTAGTGAFFRGLPATLWRDCVFGGFFGGMRYRLRRQLDGDSDDQAGPAGVMRRFFADSVAAGMATAASAPFNYARNVHFAQPITKRPAAASTAEALRSLWREAQTMTSSAEAVRFVVRRLNVGWGTFRVAGGMGLTACFFEAFVDLGRRQ